MTKDWDAVQDVIKDLSWNQRKPLEEVKSTMEQQHNFTASTRAYRLKLKEWGLLRHLPKATRVDIRARRARAAERRDETHSARESSATVESVSAAPSPAPGRAQTGGWPLVSDEELAHAEPTFMGLLAQAVDLQPSTESTAIEAGPPDILMDMLGAILDNETEKLEKMIFNNVERINDPIGLPFDAPNSRFADHPALNQMVILQHPNQKLLDIACGMPSGPIVWLLLSYGGTGSRHPLGSDLALHNAIKNGRMYSVQALLSPGRSDVNGIPGVLWTPMLQAVFWNVPDVLRTLIKRGGSVHDAGPSPSTSGTHTALQLCLERRAAQYSDVIARQKRNEILRMLLEGGANIHVAPPQGSSLTPFEKFIEPWQSSAYWNMNLSCTELACLGLFVKRGADLRTRFFGNPCTAFSSNTFEHQALWHSSPAIADLMAANFEPNAGTNGPSLLHEIIRVCPDARRHPADTLRDINLLLRQGVDPNTPDATGSTPLRKSLERCMPIDLVLQLQALLAGGADPEHASSDGVQPFVIAARTLQPPLLHDVLCLLLRSMHGTHPVRLADGSTCTWRPGVFPIPSITTYATVMACTLGNDDDDEVVVASVKEMVPTDVQPAFQRAYFAVVSEAYLEAVEKTALSRVLSAQEKSEVMDVVAARNLRGLDEWKFGQGVVVALLECLPVGAVRGRERERERGQERGTKRRRIDTSPTSLSSSSSSSSSPLSRTSPAPTHTPQPHSPTPAPSPPHTQTYKPFQFNASPHASPSPSPSLSPRPSPTPSTTTDFFIASTTQIHWSAAPPPTDAAALSKAVAAIRGFTCAVCADGVALTKGELEGHEVEHARGGAWKGRGRARAKGKGRGE